ncbi:MAG: hypothetical protein AAF581_12860 [Planctomycetota bacterium]
MADDPKKSDAYRKLFGEVALELGFVTSSQLYDALTEQVRRKAEAKSEKLLGQILLENGHITAEQIREVLDVVVPVQD